MKPFLFNFVVVILLSIPGPGLSGAGAQTLSDYTATPPFVSTVIPPNVLLLMDNSASMNSRAYTEDYDAGTAYGGYFDNTICYLEGGAGFSSGNGTPPDCGSFGEWSGNFLNWLTMRRIEIIKWTLVGGQCAPRVGGQCAPGGQLVFESPAGWSFMVTAQADGVTPFSGTRCFLRIGSSLFVDAGSNCWFWPYTMHALSVEVTSEPQGMIHQLTNRARFGLMVFNPSSEGGKVTAGIGSDTQTLVSAIENTAATASTPLAESIYEAVRYLAQVEPAYDSGDYPTGSLQDDPFYLASPTWLDTAQTVACCQSFILILTDGQPTQDTNIPAALQDYADSAGGHGPDHHDPCSDYFGGMGSESCTADGSHYLDDVAYWAHTTDLRQDTLPVINLPGNDLPGLQRVTIYTFFAFGSGSEILKDAARLGGFNDLNGDGVPGPDSMEWDEDGDGVPDAYFESEDAFVLRDRLMAAIGEILKRSAAGTSVSILSTSTEGEGALYQAYFYPSRFEGLEEIRWLGYLRGLFLDVYGHLREDTNQDRRLTLAEDRIVRMEINDETREVWANLYADLDEDGDPDPLGPVDTVVGTVRIDDVQAIWEGGELLARKEADARNIYAFVDLDGDGLVDQGDYASPSGEAIRWTESNAALLQPYLRSADSGEAADVIRFVRGERVNGYRNRCLTVSGAPTESGCGAGQRVWKLADIIYSTPTLLGAPKEQYDLLYGDTTYTVFRNAYQDRRNVVFVGANDGMLHAFNGGIYRPGDDAVTPEQEHGWFEDAPAVGNGWAGTTLGEELWAWIPHDHLPHLEWLTRTDYTHVYYNDLKPKVTDVRIFNDTATGVSGKVDGQSGVSHPHGWGTILILGMRLGGGAMDVTADFGVGMETRAFRSAYYALDVTDPEKPPRVLWRFTDPGLGMTTSYPAIVHFQAGETSPGQWSMVVGSGPDNQVPAGLRGYDGSSTQPGRVFVVDLVQGSVQASFTTDSNAFMGDPATVDTDLDFNVDVVYIGNAHEQGGTWSGGKVYRLVTHEDPDPAAWSLSSLLNAGGPALGWPAVSRDALNQFWVYFGTGRFWDTADKTNADPQAFYGIRDPCWDGSCAMTFAVSDLVDVTNITVAEDAGSATQVSQVPGWAGNVAYADLLDTVQDAQGWTLNLSTPAGQPSERVLSPPVVLGGMVMFTTFLPSEDLCTLLGDSSLYALYYETGAAYYRPVLGTESVMGQTEIRRMIKLGEGMPTTVGMAIGKEIKGFIQSSSGTIFEVSPQTPSPRSKMLAWREMRRDGKGVQLRQIYRRVVK